MAKKESRNALTSLTLWLLRINGWSLMGSVLLFYIIENNASLSLISGMVLFLGVISALVPSFFEENLQHLGRLAVFLNRVIASFTYQVFLLVLFTAPIFWCALKLSSLFLWWELIHYAPGQIYRGMLLFYLFSGLLFLMAYLIYQRLKHFKENVRQIASRLIQSYISAIALVLIIFTIEFAANLYVATHVQSWNGQALSYEHSEVYLPNDIDRDLFYEETRLFDYPLYHDDVYDLPFHHDFQGQYLNVIDHFRPTPNQPAQFDHTIYVFGGSTIFCFESPDRYTVPSYLQQEVLSINGVGYRVLNRGISGYTIDSQLRLLEQTDLQPGDVVIFIDGINDAQKYFSSYFYTYTNQNVPKSKNALAYYLRMLNTRSNLYRFFLAPQNFKLPINRNEVEISQQLVRLFHNEVKTIWRARDYTESSGATFVHFLQPALYLVSDLNRHEYEILHNYLVIPNGYVDLMVRAYDVLYYLEAKYPDWGINSYDITHAFNPEYRKTDYELYPFDGMHVGPEGNQILAEQVFLRLRPYLIPQE